MAQAALQSKPGRMRRKHPEVQRLDCVTWFGDLVIRLTTALRELSTEGRLKLLEDLTAYCGRQYGEISRHERARERRAL
jgi:hypothetical protein